MNLEVVTGLLHREEGRTWSDFLSDLGGSQALPLSGSAWLWKEGHSPPEEAVQRPGQGQPAKPCGALRHGRFYCDSQRSHS